MDQNLDREEQYEIFEGNLRKLEELISQLELWSDEYTINHKKEEVRLPEYVEMHHNLEALKEELNDFMNEQEKSEGANERLTVYKETITQKLEDYKVTEEIIHHWIKEIKNLPILMMKSNVLNKNREFVEGIYNK